MGYVQTFNYEPGSTAYAAAWPTIVADARAVFETVGNLGIKLRGLTGAGDPVADVTAGVAFNGDADAGLSLDGFHLPAPHRLPGAPQDCRVWRFVKTQGLPYDLAVAAILLRAHLLAPDVFSIGSSGQWIEDWTEPPVANPRDLVARLFGVFVDHDPLTDTSEAMALGPAGWVDPRLIDNPVIP